MPNKWTEHVKQWAKDHGSTYGCSISDPECKREYALKYPKVVKEKKAEPTKAKFNQMKKVQERRYEEMEKMGMASEDKPAPGLKSRRKMPKPKPRDRKRQMEMEQMGAEDFDAPKPKRKMPKPKPRDRKRQMEMEQMGAEDFDAPKPKRQMEMEQMGAEDFDAPKPKPKRKPRAPPKGITAKQEEHNHKVSMFAQYFPEDEAFIEENVDKPKSQLKLLAKKYDVDPKEEFPFMAILKARKRNPEMKGKGIMAMNTVEDANGLTHVYPLSRGRILQMCRE